MGARFHALTAYRSSLVFNADHLRAFGARLIQGPDTAIIVAEDQSGVIGMIGLVVYDHHLSGERVGGEIFWWVEPEKRGIGVRLLKDAERWVKARGGAFLQMIAPSPDVEQLYERLGYMPIERSYQKAL